MQENINAYQYNKNDNESTQLIKFVYLFFSTFQHIHTSSVLLVHYCRTNQINHLINPLLYFIDQQDKILNIFKILYKKKLEAKISKDALNKIILDIFNRSNKYLEIITIGIPINLSQYHQYLSNKAKKLASCVNITNDYESSHKIDLTPIDYEW